ncbi:MAG: biotin--[acetyl-CoA-carboxylase] ligase [Dehalococcoidia bacterium]|nr:MAG: biotin--[acetyl-CoA-carboxylase] ligase [Dehalococcoidia bacterium]
MTIINQRNVERALADCRWVKRILTYESIGSTMDKARELGSEGSPEATIVVAAQQTEGRGRLSRPWLSPDGSLSFSILLYPPPEKLVSLTMMAGLAVARAVEATASLKVDLKWPNDILIGDKKVAGILVESGFNGQRQYVVIGIGVNVNLDSARYSEIAHIATSLSLESGDEVDILRLLRELIFGLETLYTDFDAAGLYNAWRGRLTTLGCRVRAVTGDGTIDGVAEDVADDGTLIIRTDDGHSHTIIAGDVMLRHVA